ncbi:MAG: BatD family protein, partial [Gammaproteobacteria bacterium]|nr:BatD family protein [Gammaproteobacteria bacterium]
ASIVTEEAVRWRRGFMGSREPAQVRRTRAVDEPLSLSVRALPQAGRPASFSGTVGAGYALAVRADRSVLKAGEPINLTIEVHGDRALETLSLPPLTAMGLNEEDFKLPSSGDIAGRVDAGVKRFEVPIRVLREDVTAIPALTLSWFDPDTGRYESARSDPIALSVGDAERVGAAQVVRKPTQSRFPVTPADRESPPGTDAGDASPTGTAGLVLSGADLSIATDPERLLSVPGSRPGLTRLLLVTLYASGLIGLLAMCIVARRGTRDPAVMARRQELRAIERGIEQADNLDRLAARLRRLAPLLDPAQRSTYETLLARCEEQIFRPGGTAQAPDPALREDALRLVRDALTFRRQARVNAASARTASATASGAGA